MSLLKSLGMFLFGVLSIKTCCAQWPVMGPCPNIEVMENFNLTRYMGHWFEAERYFSRFHVGGYCVSMDFTDKGNGTFDVTDRQLNRITGFITELAGEGEMPSNERSQAKIVIVYPSLPFGRVLSMSPHAVLDTDYESYAVVWGCYELFNMSAQNAWILTRERNPSNEVLQKAYAVVNKNNIDPGYFTRTDQRNCPQLGAI